MPGLEDSWIQFDLRFLKEAGFDAWSLKQAGFDLGLCMQVSARSLKEAGFDVSL